MSEQDEGKEEKKERKFSQEQYDMLRRCSEKKDVSEWNEWRYYNLKVEIELEGVNLIEAHLEGAVLEKAHLEGAVLEKAHLEGVNLWGAHLERANLYGAYMEGSVLFDAYLESANLFFTHLERANLTFSHMERANFSYSYLEGAEIEEAYLEGTNFLYAILDDKTLIRKCDVDRKTDFRGVGLGNVRIDPGTRALLEYNVRRMNWEDWYKKKKWYWPLVWFFWWLSDYGMSTPRILAVFSFSAIGFALLYYFWGLLYPPGIVDNLFKVAGAAVPFYVVPFRALYFSVVTMTTLGFGDLHANPTSVWGHLFLAVQVILGYGILGALITRLNILFTAGGPSGDFAAEKTRDASKEPEKNGNA